MNFIFLSPHFPPNYYQFSVHLNQLGVKVLGLADEPYDQLGQDLKDCLTEYYRVNDMHNYDELLRACGYFTHKHGKIDRLDSFNEYWLESEAGLRTDFNVAGLKRHDMPKIKRKSRMKDTFKKAGVPVALGRVIKKTSKAKAFADEVGYPLVAKPDIGVGADKTYKINNEADLIKFLAEKPKVDYILEEFIDGQICSFDGLTDRDGNIVFFTSHVYSQGVMETVNNDDIVYYYSLRNIPADLESYGRILVKEFKVKERFFHFEFFRTKKDNKLIALEVNIRPPGGMTTDMFNYANDINIYHEWAHIIVHNRFTADYSRSYHCSYVGRKFNREYKYSHEQILDKYQQNLCHHDSISGVFSAALGDYGYLVRSKDIDEIHSMAQYIQFQT